MSNKDKYYKNTEKLLYNINSVKRMIHRLGEDINYFSKELEDDRIELEAYQEKEYTLDSGNGDGTGGSKYISDATLEKLVRKEYLENNIPMLEIKIEKKEKKLEREMREINRISDAINALDEREMLIINEYYINGKSISSIANKIHVTDSTVFKTKKQAVGKIAVEIFGLAALDIEEFK